MSDEDDDSVSYGSDDESITDYSSEPDDLSDDELEDVHDRLLNAIDKFSQQKTGGKSINGTSTTQNIQENAYSSALDTGVVSMDALLGALDNSKGLTAVKKRLSEFEKGLSAPVYVEKVTGQRIERGIVYSENAKDMDKWQDLVVSNRHVKTLDLAQDKRQVPSYKNLIAKYAPANDMEREIQMVLVQSGATDEEALRREDSELFGRQMTAEEFHQKQADLAKVKARMFYDQMKRHRLNKIKSKAYHRIKKRQRQRKEQDNMDIISDADPEYAQNLMEEKAAKRIKERMSLRHKNTSKWARMALEHSRGDKTLKDAYHESVQLGQELLGKINEGVNDGGDASSEESQDSWSGSDDEQDSDNDNKQGDRSVKKSKTSVASRAAKSLNKVMSEPANELQMTGKYRKLFDMDFMKRANEQQQQRAKEDAQSVLLELKGMEDEAFSDDDDDDSNQMQHDRDSKEATAGNIAKSAEIEGQKKMLAAARLEMDKLFSSSSNNTMVMKGSTNKKLSTTTTIQLSGGMPGKPSLPAAPVGIETQQELSGHQEDDCESEDDDKLPVDESNPWLAPVKISKRNKLDQSKAVQVKGKAATASDSTATVGTKKVIDKIVEQMVPIVSKPKGTGGSDAPGKSVPSKKGGKSMKAPLVESSTSAVAVDEAKLSTQAPAKPQESKEDRKPLLMQKSQMDLVQMAFAGPDLEAEFQTYKDKSITEELGFNDKRKKVLSQVKAGWGDWAGPGAMVVSDKIKRIRDGQLKSIETEENQAKKARKDRNMANVVLSERRVKTSAKYVIEKVPHPFTTHEEYERSLQMPIGEEWNASHVVRSNTKPEILTRAGRLIEPIRLDKKRSAAEKEEPKRNAKQNSGGGKNKPSKSTAAKKIVQKIK